MNNLYLRFLRSINNRIDDLETLKERKMHAKYSDSQNVDIPCDSSPLLLVTK